MIRVGLLSFAHYHANFWAEAFADDPDAVLVGVWDEDFERGRAGAARFNAPFFEELDDLLDLVDAVAITSETAQHRPLVARAAARGRHVLCEKPLATTLADADAIAGACATAGVVFMQSFPKRFDPVNHEIRNLLEANALGRIWLVRIRHGHRHGASAEFAGGWWTDAAQSGGGTLIDEGVHGADFLRWMFGEPVAVSAVRSSAMLGLAVEDLAIAIFRYADGMLAELTAGWNFVAAENSIEIYGAGGTALIGGVDLASKDFCTSGWLKTYAGGERSWNVSAIVPRFKTGGFHQQNALAFLDALAGNRPPPISVDDGARAQAMILAAYEAAALGREVAIQY